MLDAGGGGDCQYLSLSEALSVLEGKVVTVKELREDAADWLENNPKEVKA